jgi:glutathione peroxidase-family protein
LSERFPEAAGALHVFGVSSLRDNPVYQNLALQLPGRRVRHNFFKYLVDRRGMAVKLFSKKDDPSDLREEIEALLGADADRPRPPEEEGASEAGS